MIRAVLFDINGTLADDEPIHFEAFRTLFAQESLLDLTEELYFGPWLAFDDRGLVEKALEEVGRPLDEGEIVRLMQVKKGIYDGLVAEGIPLFDGAGQAVRAAAEQWAVGAVSGALRGEIETVLDRLGVRDLMRVVVGAEDVDRPKPDPECYLLALQGLRGQLPDLRPVECVAVEDAPGGLGAAKGAGMCVVAVEHTVGRDRLSQADRIVRGIGEVVGAIQALDREIR